MAERRMFAKSIVLSDVFIDMPATARCLYFTLGMLADDDGFVGNPKAIMRQCGASEDDIKVLLSKRYLLTFESGVIVIKHWRMNNYLQNDRHHKTTYIEELSTLTTDEKGAYTEKNKKNSMYTDCIQNVYIGKVSIDKDSIDKDNITTTTTTTTIATIPTQNEIQAYCNEKGYNFDIDYFIHYWTERDWKRYDKNLKKYVPIKDIKGTIRTWAKNEAKYKKEEEYKAIQNESRKTYIQTNRPKSEIVKESFDKVDEWIDKFDGKKEQVIDVNN